MSSRKHACNCDYCVSGRTKKENLRGAGDGWEETPYRKPSKKKRVKKKRATPCPENDGKGHVYVWVPESVWWGTQDADGYYTDHRGKKYRYEYQFCCGCGRRGPKSFRRTYK